MDPATFIGLLLAFGSVYAMVNMEGASLTALLLPPPMILVFGATLAIGLAGSTIKDVLQAFKSVPKAMIGKRPNPKETISKMVEIAEKARREGLLSLEAEAANTKDPFLARALQNIADGNDPEVVEQLLQDEIATKQKADHTSSKFFKDLAGYAPTVGIVGTVISLTHVLENLSKPDELGHMIAAAFVATFWGLLSSNFIWMPISTRLSRISALEVENMNLIMEGALSVQDGALPMLLNDRLRGLVPAHVIGKDKTSMKAAA
jgi:chemotaxis protein MotA